MATKKTEKSYDVSNHLLVPKHIKLSDKEKKDLLDKYAITLKELPYISIKDPAISKMDVTTKDIIKIVRSSPTSGETVYYRRIAK